MRAESSAAVADTPGHASPLPAIEVNRTLPDQEHVRLSSSIKFIDYLAVFFSHNILANSIFSNDFLDKRKGLS
jgi:hypothetical protein